MKRQDREIRILEDLIQRHKIVDANRLADRLLHGADGDARILTLAARAKLLSGNLREAKWHAEKACIKNNLTIEAQYTLAFCHQKLGEYDKAAETYRQIIDKVPKSAFAHFQLGESLLGTNKREESLQAFQKATELDKEGDIRSMAETKIIHIKEEIGKV